MKSIAIKDLSENFFEVIGKEWMLVTAGSKEHFNTMTASWGGIGWLWNKPVVFVFIRSERYTYEFMEENEYLWGIERSGFFNDREKWVKGFENQRV